jgi:hypothetical protein
LTALFDFQTFRLFDYTKGDLNAFTEKTTFKSEDASAQNALQAQRADRFGVPALPCAGATAPCLPVVRLLQRPAGYRNQGKAEGRVELQTDGVEGIRA